MKPVVNCSEPNKQLKIDFGVIKWDERRCSFFECVGSFSKFPSIEFFKLANSPNVVKFLEVYIHMHGIPRNIRLDQARCLIGDKVKDFSKNNNINNITAPANNH